MEGNKVEHDATVSPNRVRQMQNASRFASRFDSLRRGEGGIPCAVVEPIRDK